MASRILTGVGSHWLVLATTLYIRPVKLGPSSWFNLLSHCCLAIVGLEKGKHGGTPTLDGGSVFLAIQSDRTT